MLDHMTFRVTDLAATRKLYEARPLGYKVLHEFNLTVRRCLAWASTPRKAPRRRPGSFRAPPSTVSL